MQSPVHIAKPNTANRLAVQCRTEGDVKCGVMLKLKISGRKYTNSLGREKSDRPVETLCSKLC